ncbi:MAG: hypothetical protein DRJ03_03415 [Chloroflexi bacterium]|nr:MAG: hypothetical protein DRJ03_03415 [Chloroflexota bacterium]
MPKYLFTFRLPSENKTRSCTDVEVIAENLDGARKKIAEAIQHPDAATAIPWGFTENFDCPKCRPVISECNYDG